MVHARLRAKTREWLHGVTPVEKFSNFANVCATARHEIRVGRDSFDYAHERFRISRWNDETEFTLLNYLGNDVAFRAHDWQAGPKAIEEARAICEMTFEICPMRTYRRIAAS